MAKMERLALLYKVASLYYDEGLKKYEIASKVKVSATQVGLLLKEAVEEKVVETKVLLPGFTVLRQKLIDRFRLIDAVVIPAEDHTPTLLQNLSKAAAEYFEKHVKPASRIAIGGGYLMYKMVEKLPEKTRDIDIYPTAIIGRGPVIEHIDPAFLVALLWAKSGQEEGRAHYLTLTPPNDGADEAEILKHYSQLKGNARLRNLLSELDEVDYIFASVGGLNTSKGYVAESKNTSRSLFINELKMDRDQLLESGRVGDLAYSFFDKNGRGKPNWSIFPGLNITAFRRIACLPDKKVVITVGRYKTDSLSAVLKGRLCNVLITDADAAKTILETMN